MRKINPGVISSFRSDGGASSRHANIALLTTTGRVTGRPHVTPVVCFEVAETLVVAASMGGNARHPQWYRNLMVDPVLTVEFHGRTLTARAETVEPGEERDRLFAVMSEGIPDIYDYQERCKATRLIPIVLLSPLPSDPSLASSP